MSVKQKRVRFSEADKIKAVTAMRTAGKEHMLSYAAIEAARGILGVNVSLAALAKWVKQYTAIVDELQPTLNPASIDRSALVLATQNQVIDQFMGIRDKSANILNDEAVLKQTANKSARDLAVVMGIAQTHLSQMTALPPEPMQATQRQHYRQQPAKFILALIGLMRIKRPMNAREQYESFYRSIRVAAHNYTVDAKGIHGLSQAMTQAHMLAQALATSGNAQAQSAARTYDYRYQRDSYLPSLFASGDGIANLRHKLKVYKLANPDNWRYVYSITKGVHKNAPWGAFKTYRRFINRYYR